MFKPTPRRRWSFSMRRWIEIKQPAMMIADFEYVNGQCVMSGTFTAPVADIRRGTSRPHYRSKHHGL